MKNRKQLLKEDPYKVFSSMVRVTYDGIDFNASDAADIIRSVKGVTIVRILDSTERKLDRVTLNVKIRVTGDPVDAFKQFRLQAIKLYGIKKVELALKTIERA